MYEEGNKNLSLNWGSLLIKLVILAVIVFLAGLIFTKVTGKNSSSNTLASSNSDYITNISTMKTAAFEYFTKSKLPEKVGGTEKGITAIQVDIKCDGLTYEIIEEAFERTQKARQLMVTML